MIYLYRLLYFLLKNVVLLIRAFLNPSLQKWIALRNTLLPGSRPSAQAYWFHAASGEIEYCKSVIRLLKQQEPEAQIVVTYTSPSAENLFHNIKNDVALFLPLPWDQPQHCRRLLDFINPKILVFSRTDLWPELITQVKKRGIPLGLLSALPQKSASQRWLRGQFDFISSVEHDGDTRFDQVFFRLEQPPKMTIAAGQKVFVCGSTWPEDEAVLFKIFPKLLQENTKIVLSPHDVSPANISRLAIEIKKNGWSFELPTADAGHNRTILLIDRIGILADAYRFADLAFVGGSFKDKIHSVMEALCCGVPVLTGPFYRNNPEAVKYEGKYVFPATTADEMLQNAHRCQQLPKEEIRNEMQKNKNASLRVLKLIRDTILKK